MSLDHFIPELWASEIIRNNEKNLVAKAIANDNYEGEIRQNGDTVKINGIGSVDVNDYVKNSTTLVRQTLEDSQTILKIDQNKYFNFEIDDIDTAQQKPKVMAAAMREAGYALGDTMDQFVLNLVSDAGIKGGTGEQALGTNASPIEITADGGAGQKPSTMLSRIRRRMDDNSVPSVGRYVVCPPWFIQKLTIEKVISQGALDANRDYENGFVTNAWGFALYMSNNTKTTADTATEYHILSGVESSITLAEQITSMEAYRPDDAFSDALKGLHVYGAKVVRADNTVEAIFTEGSEGQ